MRLQIISQAPSEPEGWRNWRPWFAWYPKIIDGCFVWLEMVEYRPSGLYPPTFAFPCQYRLANPKDTGA